MKKTVLSVLTVSLLLMTSGWAFGQKTCSATHNSPAQGTDDTSVDIRQDGENTMSSIVCSPINEGMRSCDALGYLQNANDCPASGRLVCPFDENRFYCGGKIRKKNQIVGGVKPCPSDFMTIGEVTFDMSSVISTILANVTGITDCSSLSTNIPVYNSCIRQFCDECQIERASSGEYCVSEYSAPVYKLQCNTSLEPCADEEEEDDDDNNPPMTCSAGEQLINGVCRMCEGEACNNRKNKGD